jgi:translocation and assembly module TamB
LDLDLNSIKINDFWWRLMGDDLGIDNKIFFKDFSTTFKTFDLDNRKIDIKEVSFEKSKVTLGIRPNITQIESQNVEESLPWVITVNDFLINETQFVYDDFNAPKLAKGFDYNHINFKNTKIEIPSLKYSEKGINLKIDDVNFTDKSSLKVEKLKAEIVYNDKGVSIQKLVLKTPNTTIKTEAELKYNSIADLTSNLGAVKVDLKMDKSEIGISDVLLFNPDLVSQALLKNPKNKKISIEVILKGGLSNLLINKLKISGFEGSKIDVSGRVSDLDDLKKLNADLKINDISTNEAFVKLMMPDPSLLAAYNIPQKISLKGDLKGNAKLLNLKADIKSSLGDASLEGNVSDLADEKKIQYEGTLHTVDLAVNKFFKEEQSIGLLSTDIFLKSDATFQKLTAKGQIQKLVFGEYTYQNVDIDATLNDSILVLKAISLDPNALLNTDVMVDLKGGKYPVKGKVSIDKLNLEALHLYDLKEDIVGAFDMDFSSLLAEDLGGSLAVKGFVLGELNIGDIDGTFTNRDGEHFAHINSPFLKVDLDGEFDYYKLPAIIENEVNNYFKIDSVSNEGISGQQDFRINAVVYEHPFWGIVLPDLQFEKDIVLSSTLNGHQLNADMNFGKVKYADYLLNDFKLSLNGDGKVLKGKATLKELKSGDIELPNNDISLDVANSILQIKFNSKEQNSNTNRHSISMQLEKLPQWFKINLSQLTLDKRDFTVNDIPIFYNDNGLFTNGLTIARNDEIIVLDANEGQLKLNLTNISINPFSNFIGYTEENIKGNLSGDLLIDNYLEDYQITGEFAIKKFEVGGIEGGDLTLNLEEVNAAQMKLNGGLDGRESRLSFKGNMGLDEVSPIDFNVNIGKIDAKFIQSFSGGELKNSKGFLTGNVKISGTTDKPKADGKISFIDYNFTPEYLGIPLKIENQQIQFKGNNISFENFVVKDSLDQKMALNGGVNWSDLDNVTYDIKLNAKNFLLIDTQKGSNELFFGKANIDANLQISGTGTNADISGKIKANEQSNVTFIMPSEIETAVSNGVVSFVPPTKTEEELNAEALQIPTMQLENGTGLASEIILDIETDPRAQLNIIIDELSGDNIKVKGKANLTVGVYPTGEIFTIGVYEIASGSYDFSFEFIRKNFQIEPGSMLIWSGDPLHASLQMKAVYEVNADIQSLNTFGLNLDGFGKVPIDVILNIEGTIQNPLISFDLRAANKAESTIKAVIENNDIFANLRKNSSEMNQQVFSLLVFNKFLSAESINISSALNTQAIARQSVSKLLTEQLNVLAGDVLGSVGLNFGLNSDQLNTSDGNAYRTNLNVGLKKSFLNDRIKVSVGKNFELENSSGIDQNSAELLDNIEVGYNITADGRYMVKVYRKSQFQTVLEGFVLETGVSFVLSAEYDQMKELFKKSKAVK